MTTHEHEKVARLALVQLVDAVKRQYPSYELTCSPEVVDAIADAESVIASGGASFIGVDGTVYGSAEERRQAEQQQLGDYERMKSTSGDEVPRRDER